MRVTKKDKTIVLGLVVKSGERDLRALERTLNRTMSEARVSQCLSELEKAGSIILQDGKARPSSVLARLVQDAGAAMTESKRTKNEYGIPQSMIENLSKRRDFEF